MRRNPKSAFAHSAHPHPNLCFKESVLILADLSPKFDPYDDSYTLNDKISESNKLATEANTISQPENMKIFNPKVMSSGNLHDHLHFFTNPKKKSLKPAWHPPSARLPQDTTVYTDSSCMLNGHLQAWVYGLARMT